jgi:sulfofructose kinase
MTQRRIICVGHAALDRVYAVDAWPPDSAKVAARDFRESGGGMAANAAVAIARLGARVSFWGPAGDDTIADTIETALRGEGVDVCLRRFAGLGSSHSAVLVDARGERLVVGHRGSALQAPADWLPLTDLAGAGAVLADVRWPQGAAAALAAARAAGIPAVLDAEVGDAAALASLAPVADHVIFSQRGFEQYAGGAPEALATLVARGARVAAVTLGAGGVDWIACGGGMQHCPAFAVDVVDTLAAGDVFHGAYALAIAEGFEPARAVRFASAAAAIKCSRPGGRGGAPMRAELEAFLLARR